MTALEFGMMTAVPERYLSDLRSVLDTVKSASQNAEYYVTRMAKLMTHGQLMHDHIKTTPDRLGLQKDADPVTGLSTGHRIVLVADNAGVLQKASLPSGLSEDRPTCTIPEFRADKDRRSG